MREIVLDTETTGFEPEEGHRIVEIGCIEIIHQIPTGKSYHQYINPERDMPEDAYRVHGLSEEFLEKYPTFLEIADEFENFIADSPLIIHNAEFDMKFINFELEKIGKNPIPMQKAIDTLQMARNKFPGAPATLDALCRRFEIDNSNRVLHGALLDAELLSEVYLELLGGRQRGLSFQDDNSKNNNISIKTGGIKYGKNQIRKPRVFPIPEQEKSAHINLLKELPNNLWGNFK